MLAHSWHFLSNKILFLGRPTFNLLRLEGGFSYAVYTTAGVGLSHKESEIKPGGFVKFLPKAKVKSLSR